MFKIKDGYNLALQIPETWHYLLAQKKKIIERKKNRQNVTSLTVPEVVLVQSNLLDNQYQQKSEVLSTFTPNKSYAYLLNVETRHLLFFKIF